SVRSCGSSLEADNRKLTDGVVGVRIDQIDDKAQRFPVRRDETDPIDGEPVRDVTCRDRFLLFASIDWNPHQAGGSRGGNVVHPLPVGRAGWAAVKDSR